MAKKSGGSLFTLVTGVVLGAAAVFLSNSKNRATTKKIVKKESKKVRATATKVKKIARKKSKKIQKKVVKAQEKKSKNY